MLVFDSALSMFSSLVGGWLRTKLERRIWLLMIAMQNSLCIFLDARILC